MPIEIGDSQLVVFEIPYAIRIEDGFELAIEDDHIELSLFGGEQAHEIEVLLQNRFARLRFNQKKKRDRIHFEGPFTVEGDRLGRSLSTEVLMHFSDEFMDGIPADVIESTPSNYHEGGTIFGSSLSPPIDKYLVTWAVNFLNKFLEHYRFFENEYWIKSLTPQSIQEFHLWRIDGTKIDRHRRRIWTRGPSKGGHIETEKLQKFLRTDTGIPLLHRLRLNSRDNIDITDYQEAIIQTAQLFELWIINAYILISKANGVDEREAESEVTKPNGDYFHPYNVMDKLNSNYNYNFKDTDEFEYWENSCKNIRNEIIHRGYEPSRSEAFEAYEACMESIYNIQETFRSEISQATIKQIHDTELPGSNILIEKSDDPM